MGSENKPTKTVNSNYVVKLNDLEIQLKSEIQNSKVVQPEYPIIQERQAKINEIFLKQNPVIKKHSLTIILDKEMKENNNQITRNEDEPKREESSNNQ